MTLCSHQQWLRIHQEGNEFILQDGNRLGHIAKSFPRPAKQYPSLVHFIGTQNKSRALRAIFPENSISNCRKYGVANICADLKTSLSDYPILIAESTPDHVQANLRGKLVCHETTNNPVAWQDDESGHCTAQSLADYLHARLLSMFVDVLCLFAEDYGSLDHLAERLASWTTLGSASSLPTNTRPRLIVITSIPGHTFNAEALRFRLTVLSHPKFAGSFASLKLVNVLGSKNRSSTLFSGVEEVIRHDINLARIERGNAHAMFSMVHIARFFASALHNFCTSPRHTFDFIKSSRESNPLSPNLENHLRSFLRLSLEHMLNDSILWSFISSAIMLDFFPPDMHCKYYPSFEEPANTDRGQVFNPSEVFRVMYYQVCVAAISDFATSTNSSGEVICGKIEAQMIQMFSFMKFEGNSAAILRLQCLREDSGSWQLLKSNVDCFICLQRKPEHITECGHGLCDFCIRIPNFSKPMKGREYCYEIDNCPQCQREIHFQARTLPPTCRIRFLGIDGGGSRGIVSLGFIEALREALGLNYPVQENFDYAIGTSSGRLDPHS
ncbi:MAG: hypothetical protein CL912_02880 [Deltaproteobacteria bacterium]|nr:hypothetical protein [Deltaproteobacteria bacterium]